MKDFLPLFPLKLVVFPDEKLNLHVFEPRYKQLVRECEQNGTTFGVPAFLDNKISDYGTELELLSIEKRYDSGELDIKTKGIGVFKIDTFYRTTPNKLYSGADIERMVNQEKGDLPLYELIREKVAELFTILNLKDNLNIQHNEFNTYHIAHHVGFSLEQEYEFLCLMSERQRQNYMFEHLQKLLPVVREMERLKKRAQLNGHFKNVISPK
jgi:Lon protease-like protein